MVFRYLQRNWQYFEETVVYKNRLDCMLTDTGALSQKCQYILQYWKWYQMNISDTQVAGELNGLLNLLFRLEITISLKKISTC